MQVIKLIIIKCLILCFYINQIKANIIFNSHELALASSLDYTKELTGSNPQATPYFGSSSLGSYSNLYDSVGRLAPYAPEYQYFNSDYYYPTEVE